MHMTLLLRVRVCAFDLLKQYYTLYNLFAHNSVEAQKNSIALAASSLLVAQLVSFHGMSISLHTGPMVANRERWLWGGTLTSEPVWYKWSVKRWTNPNRRYGVRPTHAIQVAVLVPMICLCVRWYKGTPCTVMLHDPDSW